MLPSQRRTFRKKVFKNHKNKKDYIIYTVIAVVIVVVLGFLFLLNSGTLGGNNVETEPQISESSGEVSVTILPAGSDTETATGDQI